jgi:hypothetical protein
MKDMPTLLFLYLLLLLLLPQSLKINVDMLKLIQLGLTFTDAEGNLPVCNGEHTVWQFNFRGFRLAEDVYAQDSIELLKISGIDFAQVGWGGVVGVGACGWVSWKLVYKIDST